MPVQTTYTDSRARLASLMSRAVEDRETVIITRRGKPEVALIAAEEHAGRQGAAGPATPFSTPSSLRDPFAGVGKPEPLKYLAPGVLSRRLTQEHRIVYRVSENRIGFLQARYHYY